MSEGLLIKGTTNITSGSDFNQNDWAFSSRKLIYAIYQDESDILNKIIVKMQAKVTVKNNNANSRTLPTGTALNANVNITDKPTTETGHTLIDSATCSLAVASLSFTARQSKDLTFVHPIHLERGQYDKIYVTVSTPSGAGNSALNNVSNFQINLPGLKELVGNSNRRVTFTSGGTKYGITNMY